MESASDHSEKHAHNAGTAVKENDVDVAAALAPGSDVPLDPAEAQRLKRKIDWHLMPLMCILYAMTFADKITLGQSAVLGIIPDNKLTQNQFNWLNTIFYLSYLVFEYPQNLALQKLPVGKWMSINIFVWAVALLAHSACKSFGALFAVRFILGMCEGAITPGFMLVTSMFYTRKEQTRRVSYWFLMNGFGIIFLGLIAFGLIHTKTKNFHPWQWLMVITGLITLVVSILFWFLFPDSPVSAYFLTPEERVAAVQRIKVNQQGVENKHWKREQFIEALRDPKTWLLAFFVASSNIFNSITNQRQLIVQQFGFTVGQTTLVGTIDGAVQILAIFATIALVPYIGHAYAAVAAYLPGILGTILVNTLPSHNKIGLLFAYWVSIFSIVPFLVCLAWMGSITAGHTKKTTVNAIVLIFYAIGNAAGPLMWKKEYQPRNRVPWAILSGFCLFSALLILTLRTLLASENRRREAEQHDDKFDDVYLTHVQPDGTTIEKKVDRAFLDLTDRQNREFRYIL
ncbi:putative membrane transporter [Lyophyllum shimeji]|uniref:Membrane transporter n=1 Tax=Lyophyllum shimeji TaxID=47721 RepID=A0A9P3UKT4_LYOSH|nr:putative membrane transporter [Lyophyllum shimeji]